MKTKFYNACLSALVIATSINLHAQTNIFPSTGSAGIGTTTPDASSLLEIKSTTKGFLISRVTKTQRDAIVSPAEGLMIYQTNSTPGFYYYDGAAWKAVTQKSKGWSLTGNSGTDPSVNFIGTTDDQPLNFRVNNLTAGRIEASTSSVFFGVNAGINTTGQSNTLIGSSAGSANTTGQDNTAIGSSALAFNTTGQRNTTLGSNALATNGIGSYNTATGYGALRVNTSGANNVANGGFALANNTTGNLNTALGYQSLINNTTASNNVAIGGNALYSNTTGTNNTACGISALNGNTTGSTNTATGYYALYGNTTGSSNVAMGYRALASNSGGYSNIAIGTRALFSNTIGNNSVAVGDSALYHSYAPGNTAVGSKALYSATTASFNAAIGYRALYTNTTGDNNTATGHQALYYNTTGTLNTANGSQALYANTTGYGNTASGFHALTANTTGIQNTAVGYQALSVNTTGNFNTAVGGETGTVRVNNTYCSFLGYGASQSISFPVDITNSMALGFESVVSGDNDVVIGNSAISSIGGYVDWSNFSDGRYKKDIQENVPGLKFINALKPVTYHLDVSGISNFLGERKTHQDGEKTSAGSSLYDESVKQKEQIVYTGFIEQDVEAVAKKLNYDFSGVDKPQDENGLYGLRYAEFVVPLVKAVQELSSESALRKQNESQQKINQDLEDRLSKIEALMNVQVAEPGGQSTMSNQMSNQLSVPASPVGGMSGTSLQQNIPNPFNQTTTINYTLPQTFSSAKIIITDESGKIIRSTDLFDVGKGSMVFSSSFSSAFGKPTATEGAGASYQYSLYIDGRMVETKQMILSK